MSNAVVPAAGPENVVVPISSYAEPSDGEREFADLFRTYHPVIVRAAYNRLNDLADAEDAAAEVFARAWRRRDDGEQVFTIAWLYSTLRNVVGTQYRDRLRRAKRLKRAEAQRPEPAVTRSDDELDVRNALLRLDLKSRELLWMAYWEDLTRDEMAAILGCTPATLRTRLLRARAKLAAAIEGSGASPSERAEELWTTPI